MKICAGIVTYNPDIERLKSNINGIINQVDKVYIFDNDSNNISDIQSCAGEFKSITVIDNKCNYGIAKALNEIFKLALENGYQWVLTLDQDTICPKDLMKKMSVYTAEIVGIVCPAVCYDQIDKYVVGVEDSDEIEACMTSGSLTSVNAWAKVGGFNEQFFIDYVDNDFCMKLRIHKYKIIRVNTCIINHQLGEVKKTIIGKKLIHKPWRLFYMIRNNLIYIYRYKERIHTQKEWMKLFYIIIYELSFSDEKKEKLKNILLAYKEARNIIKND